MAEPTNTDMPTVVLVHGAFADASSWNGVITRLQSNGVPVTAPANPLRGIVADSAYAISVFAQIDGPVLAVGHSYGGAVITNAAANAKNVVGLVFVAAFAPEEGEALGLVEDGSKDSVLNSALVPRTYPNGSGGSATEFYIDPAKARDAFAGDLRRAGRADRSHSTARVSVGLLRAERAARVEAPAVLGRRRHRRQGRRHRRGPARWRSALEPRSRRSLAPTSSWSRSRKP